MLDTPALRMSTVWNPRVDSEEAALGKALRTGGAAPPGALGRGDTGEALATWGTVAPGSLAAVDIADQRFIGLASSVDGDAADAIDDNGRFRRSLTNALTPCWGPLTKRGPRAVVALSGGRNPIGVGISAGLVDQPKFGSP